MATADTAGVQDAMALMVAAQDSDAAVASTPEDGTSAGRVAAEQTPTTDIQLTGTDQVPTAVADIEGTITPMLPMLTHIETDSATMVIAEEDVVARTTTST